MRKVLDRLLARAEKFSLLSVARQLWAREPARIVSVTAAVVVFLVAKLGVVVPVESVSSALAVALPMLLGGELIRSQVTPAASVPTKPKD